MAVADPLLPLLDLPDVGPAADAARDAVDDLRRNRVLRRSGEAVSAEAALHAARASAALDGSDHPLEAVRAGEVEDPVLQGALRVSTAVGPAVPTWTRAPLQVLARMHALAAGGLAAPDALGRPAGAGDRLTALARLVVDGTQAPGVVLAAIVHAEVLTTRAFPIGGGVVARAAARLSLIATGVDPQAYSVPEVGHAAEPDEYKEALAAYADGSAEGVRRWLVHACGAVEAGAREGAAICEAVRRR